MHPGILVTEIDRIRTFIRSKAGNDQFDVIRMLEILSGQELHAEAATLAGEEPALVPKVKSRDFERRAYAAIQAAETAESLVLRGRSSQAVEVIEAATTAAGDFGTKRKP